MKLSPRFLAASVLGAASLALVAASTTASPSAAATYQVTVTNLTRSQIMSPVLAAAHDDTVRMFEPGQPASAELGLLAEEGDPSMLSALLAGASGVSSQDVGAGMLLPGKTETLTLTVIDGARSLSLASMIVSTNDSFAGLDSYPLPASGSVRVDALAWDAGTEFDSESCAFIPGPPCGSAGAHDPAAAEGFVHVSDGIHGIGNVPVEVYDWRGPVARVTITRLN